MGWEKIDGLIKIILIKIIISPFDNLSGDDAVKDLTNNRNAEILNVEFEIFFSEIWKSDHFRY